MLPEKGYGRGSAPVLRQAVHKRLLAHQRANDLPTANRFILYDLRQHQPAAVYGHKSRGRAEARTRTSRTVWLRNQDLVPWNWMVDETRPLTEY